MFILSKTALLALETGDTFLGRSIGSQGVTAGEVVFNTAMSGYQEILTDPSYAHQLVTLTYPHIGNTGINTLDNESETIFAKGLIIRDLSLISSSWRSETNLSELLIAHNIIAISDIDTRALTHILRTKGALRGCIVTADKIDKIITNLALKKARAVRVLDNLDLAKVVSTKKPYRFTKGVHHIRGEKAKKKKPQYTVAVYDYGVKKNILRLLVDRGCKLTVFPAQAPVSELLKIKPDGVFLSNGPGDPCPCDYAICYIQELLKQDMPIFGICLGHQLLALANGARTGKMKFGHHGANHPVKDMRSERVMITSQNHGFDVLDDSIGKNLYVTHRSLFDDSIQGLEVIGKRAFGFQGHPEASPGTHDMTHLFDKFIDIMR